MSFAYVNILITLLILPFHGKAQDSTLQLNNLPRAMQMENYFIERSMTYNSGWDIDYTTDFDRLANQYINSGNILFHGETQLLLDSVLSRLAPQKGYRIFHFRSNQVVPFSNSSGEIFISTGLLSKVKSTDELAFFVAREIARIELNRFPTPSLLRTVSYEEKLASLTTDELENELLLDSLGMETMIHAGFKKEHVSNALDIITDVHLPFSNLSIDLDYFNSEHLNIPPSFFAITEIEQSILNNRSLAVREMENRINRRKSKLYKGFGNIEYFKVKVEDQKLYAVQQYARTEFVRQDILSGNYIRSVFCISMLERMYGKSNVTERLKAHTWYGFSLSKLDAFQYSPNTNYTDFQANNAAFFLSLNRTDANTIVTLAMRMIYDLRSLYPEDRQINDLWMDLIWRLNKNFRFDFKQFSKMSTSEVMELSPELFTDSTFQFFAISDIVSDSSFWSDCSKIPESVALGKNDRIVIYPCFSFIRKNELNLEESASRLKKLESGLINLNEHFRVGDFSSLDTKDQSTVKQVFSQLYSQGNYNYSIPVMNTEDLLAIDSYGEYIMFPFFQTEFKIRLKKYYMASMFIVTIPFLVPDMLIKSHHSAYGMILIERSTGKLIKSEYHDFNEPLNSKIMLNRIYNSLYEINRKVL